MSLSAADLTLLVCGAPVPAVCWILGQGLTTSKDAYMGTKNRSTTVKKKKKENLGGADGFGCEKSKQNMVPTMTCDQHFLFAIVLSIDQPR